MTIRLRAWGPAAAWAAVLFLSSALPIRPDHDWWFTINDKIAHLGLYSVLGVALAYVRFQSVRTIPHLLMIALGALYGVSDEWHQSFVPGRSPSAADWGADVAGVVLGYGLVMLFAPGLGRRAREAETKESTT